MKGNRIKATLVAAMLLVATVAFGASTLQIKKPGGIPAAVKATVKAPRGLMAAVNAPGGVTAAVTTSGTVTLTWTADGTPSGFTIQRASFPSGLASYKVSGSVRSFTQSGLTKGGIYHYRVRADTSTRSSDYSSVVDIAVP